MKTFEQWLETVPAWIKPRDHEEQLRMQYAFADAQLEFSELTMDLMHKSMARVVKAGVDHEG